MFQASHNTVVATKCVILDNLLQNTGITSFLATNGNFIIKYTIRYVHSFSSTSLNFNFPAGAFVQFCYKSKILELVNEKNLVLG